MTSTYMGRRHRKINKFKVMNNKDFIAALSVKEGLNTRNTQMLVNHLIAEMTEQLEEGNSLFMKDFGQFDVKKRLERVFISPTGQRMLVPPKLVLGFRPSPNLKGRMQKGGDE